MGANVLKGQLLVRSSGIKQESLTLFVAFLASISFFFLDRLFLGRDSLAPFEFRDLVVVLGSYTIATSVLEHGVLEYLSKFLSRQVLIWTSVLGATAMPVVLLMSMVMLKSSLEIYQAVPFGEQIPHLRSLGWLAAVVIVLECLWVSILLRVRLKSG